MTTSPMHRRRRLGPARALLAGLAALGAAALVWRLWGGGNLAAAANGAVVIAGGAGSTGSWGLWTCFGLLFGVSLAVGGGVIAGLVHLLNLQRFRPLVRPALMTGLLGYVLVAEAMLVDLGGPKRVWLLLRAADSRSLLLEVTAWGVMFMALLLLEFSPWLLRPSHPLRPVLAWPGLSALLLVGATGLALSHQSALCTLFASRPVLLHPLWRTPALPLFFALSAGALGMAVVTLACALSTRLCGHGPKWGLLSRLGRGMPWVLGCYLILKLGELAGSGEVRLALLGNRFSALFWTEIGAGVVLPLVLFAFPSVRRSRAGLPAAAALVVGGVALNRFNVSWLRMAPTAHSPANSPWLEGLVITGIVAAGVLLFDYAARHLPLFADPVTEPTGNATTQVRTVGDVA